MNNSLNARRIVPIEEGKDLLMFKLIGQCVKSGSLRYTGSEVILSENERDLLDEAIADEAQNFQKPLGTAINSTQDVSSRAKEFLLKSKSISNKDRKDMRLNLFYLIAELVREGEIKYIDGRIMPNKEQEEMISELQLPEESNYETRTVKTNSIVIDDKNNKQIKTTEYTAIYFLSKDSSRK